MNESTVFLGEQDREFERGVETGEGHQSEGSEETEAFAKMAPWTPGRPLFGRDQGRETDQGGQIGSS